MVCKLGWKNPPIWSPLFRSQTRNPGRSYVATFWPKVRMVWCIIRVPIMEKLQWEHHHNPLRCRGWREVTLGLGMWPWVEKTQPTKDACFYESNTYRIFDLPGRFGGMSCWGTCSNDHCEKLPKTSEMVSFVSYFLALLAAQTLGWQWAKRENSLF